MMKSLPNRAGIIRGRAVDGIVFCSSNQELESATNRQKQEQEQLKTLEDFWLDKGFQQGFSRGLKEGAQKGFQDGLQQGIKQGQEEGVVSSKQEFYQQGFDEGLAKAKAELQQLFEQGATLADGIAQQRQHLIEEMQPILVQMCRKICDKILRKAIENEDVLMHVIESLIKDFEPVMKEQVITFVFSQELSEAIQKDLGSFFAQGREIQIEQDQWLTPGSFRIEFATGLLSFNIDRQLDELEKLCLEKG
jgi:flagellar biosynthesis/type III secretory pathway protein FliH